MSCRSPCWRRGHRPRGMPVAVASLAALLLAALGSGPAQAEVRRCERADGSAIYTDRACGEFGAIEQARSHAPAAARPVLRSGCARSLQDLISEVSTAIQDHDANRLAGVYHWVGMSDRSSHAVMTRLDALVRRPLVDVVPVVAPAAAVMTGEASGQVSPASAERLVALRLEQTQENGITPAPTTFGLQRHFGCLWISG